MDILTNRNELIKKAGFSVQGIPRMTATTLSKAEIASQLKVDPAKLTETITLTPGKPRIGKNHLSFYSPLLMLTEEASSNNLALYSSEFQDIGFVGVQVSFLPIKTNKPHLVEFNVTLNAPEKVYKFRLFEYPTAVFQDISLSNQKVISVVIDAVNADPITLGAQLQQRNTVAEKAGWILHSVRITAVG